MSDLSHFPFDVTGTESETPGEVGYIFDALGVSSWESVLHDNNDIDPRFERASRYLTPEEALRDMFDRGISSFTTIRYLPDDDLYALYIEYVEP